MLFYLLYTIFKQKKIDLFSPFYIFPLFFILYLSIGSASEFIAHEQEITGKQWILYALALLFFFLGTIIPFLLYERIKPKARPAKCKWDKSKLLQITSLIFILAVAARSLIYVSTGIPLLASNVNLARQQAAENGYLGMIALSTEIVFMVSFVAVLKYKHNRKLFFFFMIFSLAFSILTGSRQSFIRMIFPCLVFFHYYRKKISAKAFVVAFIIIAVFIGSIGFYRRHVLVQSTMEASLTEYNYNPFLFWAPFAVRELKLAPEGLAIILETFPKKISYQKGKLHISPLLMPLPGEQEQPDMFFKRKLGMEWVGFGLASTMLAPQYADFGIMGIFVGMFFVGFILSHLYFKARVSPSPLQILIYGVVLGQMLIAVRSNYLNFVIIWTLILLTIIHFFARKKT